MSAASTPPPTTHGKEETKLAIKKPPKLEIELDVTKLHSLPSEQQDLYLFTYVISLEKNIFALDEDALKQRQKHLKKELIQIISLQAPTPTRVVRNSVGRCFGRIFSKGDRKLLFETITELGDSLNITKADKDPRNKHAAVYCLGEIYKAAGDGAINVSSVICTSLTKLYKSASNHVALRAVIFKALGKIVASVSTSIDENIAREVWKQARSAASSDRGALVQINACWCLEQLINGTSLFSNTGDFDSLKSTIWKVGDSPFPTVRHASASCLASVMVKGYSETISVVPLPKTPKFKKTKKLVQGQNVINDAEDSDTMRLASPAWKKSSLKLELTLTDILRQLSAQYVRSPTSNRARATIMSCYSKVLRSLDVRIVEANFSVIADHLLIDILSSTVIAHHRYRLLLTRRFVQKLLAEVVGRQILGESAQINAAKTLINEFLKTYPQVLKETPEPSKNTLTGALNVLASFIQSLGSAFSPLADICRDALMQVLQHPSYTVQIHASHCLRLFTLACPQQLLQCASICMNSVNRELGLLTTGRNSTRKCVGYANGLAAVLSISSLQPLYSSLEISSRVLQQAINLLKSSVNATDLRVSATQVQVAWILIGGLMSLGPNFVKIHLSQLLHLWRNALPRALTRENAAQRQAAEMIYLTHVRECALGSILSFLEFNSRLLTTDVSKRIAAMLQNTIEFLEGVPVPRNEADTATRITPSLQLSDIVQMVRRRVMQCYTRLATQSPHTSKEVLSETNLITFAVSCFAEPEAYAQGSLGTSIANSAGTFESIWNVADNSGFGISGTIRGLEIQPLPGEYLQANKSSWHRLDESTGSVDSLLLSPVCGAREHDSVYRHLQDKNGVEELPYPPATEVVNSAIALFAMALPLQEPKIQESILEQLSTFMTAKSLQRDPGRKAAVKINIALALLGALKVTMGETLASPGDLKSSAIEKCLDDLLRTLIIDSDKYVRNAAYEALGRLCNGSGNAFTTNVVNSLIDTIVSDREPNARAGCAMALGSIHANVGGIAAGFHLRKIHGVLMSLCSDPHPTVHFWAIEALSKVAESAGLTFSGYMPSTLGLLAQLWLSDTHCEEADAVGTSNAELEMPTPAAIAHTIASLINVLGPDLQDMAKARDLILTLVRQFDLDDLSIVQGQALQCWEHIYLYAPAHVELKRYVRQLQNGLNKSEPYVRDIAVDGLYSLIRRNAENTLELAAEGIEDQLWSSLDRPSDQSGIRSILDVWLQQTSLIHTAQWIVQCQEVMMKTVARVSDVPQVVESTAQSSVAPNIQDEEVAGFALGDAKDENGSNSTVGQELLRWQIRAFALKCLNDMFMNIARDVQINPNSVAGLVLQQKLGDLIRMAFLASTSSVVELRIGGLKLIDQVLTLFGKTPDPDFAEALLLEQYQAQISSALTPAFGSDSTPELASAAISVCATFIATGLVTDVDRMGRILKLLVSALTSFTVETADPAIGDLKGLSSNAQIMIKMAVLSAWAELQVASTEQEYLVGVVKPHVANLTPLWLSSLQEFARLRFEPDISSSMGVNADDGLDTIYAAMNRQTLLKFYQDSWLRLVDAIASLIDQDSDFVFDALDGKKSPKITQGEQAKDNDINYRDEPVAFFFVLFGIAFEALIVRPDSESQETQDQTLDILLALKKILRPSVSGHAIYQDVVFSETMELLDRLALTEGHAIQGAIVEITRNLCLSHPSVGEDAAGDEHLSEDIEQLFELTRIIVLVLAGALPNLGEKPSPVRHQLTEEMVSLVMLALEALVDASDVFPSIIRTDLHACIIHIFTTILGTGACQDLVIPKALPLFKRFITNITDEIKEHPTLSDQITNCLYRFRAILVNAQRRESEASLQCARNTLMASVILLTSGSACISSNEPTIIKLLDDLLECLQDVGLGRVAANCMRSLLISHPKNETDQAIARYLFPRLLHFLLDETQRDPENASGLITQALISYASTLDGDESGTILCVLVPVLLQRASMRGKESYTEIAARLLALAGINQAAFKGVVPKLDVEQRAFMEEIIKEGGAGRRDINRDGEEKGEPTIALKLTFGSR